METHVVDTLGAFRFAVPGGALTALVLAAAFALLVAWEHRRQGVWRWTALRALTACLALLVSTQPRWSAERTERTQGRIAVLVDGSRSMAIEDPSRAERVRALLERWAGASDGASLWRFGSELQAVAWDDDASRPRDDESRLGAALRELAAARDAEGLGAVVVVSDGAVTDVEEGLDLGELRVHAVRVGREDLRDDSLVQVHADPVAFLRQPAKVRVVVRSWGGGDLDVPVTLREGSEVVTEARVRVPDGGEAVVELPFTPRRLGRSVYRVSIPRAADDAVPENNERAFLVRVGRDRLRVLLVAGSPTWDVRFLRAFLKQDPSVDLISFFILRTGSDMPMAQPEELALIPFPTDELFREHLGSFDVVLFQNFDYGPYQMAGYLPRIRDYVKRGGAFAMIGGDKSFASGGYASTPLEEVLPVDLPSAATPASRLVVTDRFRPEPVAELVRHPLLALANDPAASLARWAALPPLDGANVVRGARPGATTLLTHPRRRGGQTLPVLVLGTAEEGRVLALMADTSWRWGFTSGGLTGDASTYERFWDRALRWLARDPALEPARVTTDRERYGPEARVELRARLSDASYRPFAAERVRLALVDAAGAEVAAADVVTDAEGRAEAVLRAPAREGAYRAVASREDATLCEEHFVVERGGQEFADPRAAPARLRALAEGTGGRYVDAPEEAPGLDGFDASIVRRRTLDEVAPFAHPLFVAFAALVFSLEWWLRRRRGLR